MFQYRITYEIIQHLFVNQEAQSFCYDFGLSYAELFSWKSFIVIILGMLCTTVFSGLLS